MANESEARDLYEQTSRSASRISDRISEEAEKAKSKVVEVGRRAGEQMDEQRTRAASAMESGAASLHEKAENLPGGPKVRSMARGTAEKLQATAEYIREHDAIAMMDDVRELIRRHPGEALGFAVVFGFVLGRAFRSSD